jgi:putative PIN family toxin of toxin-antitoxin system
MGHPFEIFQRWQTGEFDILLSQPIIDEVLRVTGYKRIQKKYPSVKEQRLKLVKMLRESATWVNPLDSLHVVTADESDNRYFECAVEGGAQYIVSGDRHLLDIGEYGEIRVLTPAVFLTFLDSDLI